MKQKRPVLYKENRPCLRADLITGSHQKSEIILQRVPLCQLGYHQMKFYTITVEVALNSEVK